MLFKIVLPKIRVININFFLSLAHKWCFFFFIIQFVLTFIRICLHSLMTTKTSYCILLHFNLSFGMRSDMKFFEHHADTSYRYYYWFLNNYISLAGHEHQKCKPILLLYFIKIQMECKKLCLLYIIL